MPSLFIFLIAATCIRAENVMLHNETKLPEKQHSIQVCHNKVVGTRGHITSDRVSSQPSNSTCHWELDVTRGHVAVLEFEYLRLPDNQEGMCESNVQISYGPKEDQIRRIFCSSDQLDTIYTDSQVVLVQAVHRGTCQTQCNEEYGFKINFSGVATGKFTVVNQILIILLAVCVIMSLAVCAFCFSCSYKRHYSTSPREPNRQPLQDIVEFQRHPVGQSTPAYVQEPRKLSFSIFQSKTGRNSSNLRRWASNSHIETNTASRRKAAAPTARRISIATTPRSSIFPTLKRKWSESSVQRIQHLKTRLANRFSSTSSDVSVAFSDSMYSQLRHEEDDPHDHKNINIPSIVIEFVE